MYDLAWEKSWMHKIKEPSVKVQWYYVPRESCRDIYPVIQRKKKQTKKVSGVKLLKNMTVLQFGVGSLK